MQGRSISNDARVLGTQLCNLVPGVRAFQYRLVAGRLAWYLAMQSRFEQVASDGKYASNGQGGKMQVQEVQWKSAMQ